MKTFGTLRRMLARNLEYNPEKIALIEGERQYTFRDFSKRTYGIGNALLGLGLKKGERVAVLSRNSIESAESYFSIPNAGLVLVMLNFRLAAPELLAILADARVSATHGERGVPGDRRRDEIQSGLRQALYLHRGEAEIPPKAGCITKSWRSNPHAREPAVEISEDDLAALMYTSGTTGLPKGCMATHRNFYHIGRSLNVEMRTNGNDVGIIACPLFHATGEVVLMNGMYGGATSVIMPQWEPEEFMRCVDRYRVTTGMIATPMLLFLADHPKVGDYDLSSMKKIFFAGAPVTPVIFQKAIERFGNVFVHLYGTTETVGQATILRLEEVDEALAQGRTDILASCGRSFADMESVVVDENDNPVPPGVVGELKVRGLGAVLGYWNKEEETRKDFRNGWYYPLDLCRVDDRGFIYVVDRKKDMIITGAENVYPAEVESVLYRHPAVRQAAVIGTSDKKWGEAVTAIIVRKENAVVTEEDIRSFCKKEIAGYKVPRKVFFVESLPMSASGKLLKFKLRQQFS